MIQKGGRELKLPMTPPLRNVLDGLGVASGRLFRWPDGRIMQRFPRKAWMRACVKAGLAKKLELPYTDKTGPPADPRQVAAGYPLPRPPALHGHARRGRSRAAPHPEAAGALGGADPRALHEPRRPALRRAALKPTRLMGVEPTPPAFPHSNA